MSFDFDLPHAGGNLAGGAGVQPWSSPEQFVIFSIDFVPGYTSKGAVALRIANFESYLRQTFDHPAIGFKRLEGSYKGQQEPAWIVNARDWRQIAASGWIDGQESVLHLGPYDNGSREATLHFNGNRHDGDVPQSIGRFHQEAKAYALKQDAWTFDPSTGDYFICD